MRKIIPLYRQALELKPNDLIVQKKLNAAETKCKEIQTKAAQDKEKIKQYNNAIAKADSLFKNSNYNVARIAYLDAQKINPTKDYPSQKIKEIDNILKEQDKEKEQQYKKAISDGDRDFAAKNYTQAKQDYENALKLKPGQDYPTQRINDIAKIIADQDKLASDQKAKQDAYNAAIIKADNLFKSQQYDQALIAYNEATSYKPEEQYPYTKKDEIAKIKKQQEIEANYKKAITEGDSYFNQKSFEQAKTSYNKALSFKNNDAYATSQIAIADKEIADQLKKLCRC